MTNKLETPHKYGYLLGDDIKIHRSYFEEMCRMIGINVLLRIPKPGKHYTNRGELDTNYEPPRLVSCIFNEYPDQKTMKKLGWVSELSEQSSIISMPYDTEGLQKGALVIIPSGLDHAEGRVFRIKDMSNIMIYPASITCEIAPEWENSSQKSEVIDFKQTDFNLLYDDEEDSR